MKVISERLKNIINALDQPDHVNFIKQELTDIISILNCERQLVTSIKNNVYKLMSHDLSERDLVLLSRYKDVYIEEIVEIFRSTLREELNKQGLI